MASFQSTLTIKTHHIRRNSGQYHPRQPVHHQASDRRPTPGHVVRRRAVDGHNAHMFHVWRVYVLLLSAVRKQLGRDVTKRLVTALVLSHLDYCNAVLAGLPASTLAPFQWVLHAMARTVLDLKPCDRVTPAVQELHWLPVTEKIQYKLCLMVHKW